MTDAEEVKELCSTILLQWFLEEKNNTTMKYNEEDKEFLKKSFIANVLLKKFEVFDIKIHLPTHLLMILSLCTNENPGQAQIILKKLLLSIKDRRGLIPENYVITSEDFVMCFPTSFPIMEIPAISESFEILWNQQKKQGKLDYMESDNLCDTPEWWKEVMK